MNVSIAYIVLAHRYPLLLSRLLKRLDDGNNWFFIHIDKSQDSSVFIEAIRNVSADKVKLVKSEAGDWGGFGIVQATINAMEAIDNGKENFDFISLISGQDYPLVSNLTINDFLASNLGRNFINYWPMPAEHWHYGGMNRVEEYFIGDRVNPDKHSKKKMRIANSLARRISFFRRKLPIGMKHFGGSQWWTISLYASKYILNFIKLNPAYIKFHKFSLLPDELFFQTILLNSHDELISKNIVNDNMRYIDWSENKGSPATLTERDFKALIQSHKLYARKFDLNIDERILDKVDERILKESN